MVGFFSPPPPGTIPLSRSWFAGKDRKQKEHFVMPISRTTLENAALAQGFSRGKSKAIARRIIARPDWDDIQHVLTERFWHTHADPTAWSAIWNTLTAQLTHNHQEEAA